ncbi:MAG: tetratricopeptide repeat protein [Bacteroidota bacterium]
MKFTSKLVSLLVFASLFIACNNYDREKAEEYEQQAVDIAMQGGDLEEAIQLLDKAIEADASWAKPHNLKSTIYMQERDFDKVLEETEMIIEKDDDNGEAYVLSGIIYENRGDKDKAFDYYNKSVKIFEDKLASEGDEEDEMQELEGMPSTEEVNLIFSYILLEDEENANKHIDKLVEQDETNSQMLQQLRSFDKETYFEQMFSEQPSPQQMQQQQQQQPEM